MRNEILVCLLAGVVTCGSAAAQSAPTNASGAEAVTRTRSTPATVGAPVEAPPAADTVQAVALERADDPALPAGGAPVTESPPRPVEPPPARPRPVPPVSGK
jgi:hypothetical protein